MSLVESEERRNLPATVRAPLVAGHNPRAIVPSTIEEAYRLAQAVATSGMAPKGYSNAEQCMVAIMRGLEIGLTPFQALDKIAIVNGRPMLWGDGVIGLVRGSGLCEFIQERIEGEGDSMVAICVTKRKGEPEPVEGRFSVAQAKKASLWGKSGPWQQYPERMLKMRARGFCLRDTYADVLGGLYIREEIEEREETRPEPPRETILTRLAAAAGKGAPPPDPVEDSLPVDPVDEQVPLEDGEVLEVPSDLVNDAPVDDDGFPGDTPADAVLDPEPDLPEPEPAPAPKPARKANEPKPPPPPATESQYVTYFEMWALNETDAGKLQRRWNNERDLRVECAVSDSVKDDLRKQAMKRIDQLKSGAP